MIDPRHPPASRRPEGPSRRKRFRVENFNLLVMLLLIGASIFLAYWLVAKLVFG